MPRIIPLQLLKCLKVLLDDNGGILSTSEVKRIAGLMVKYSKKLVSKCIYVQILKCTKTELLGEFMCVGGWTLVYTWLTDGIRAMNWPLVQEILELLLLCPVDVHRLKINSAPKVVKGLCKDGGNEGVRILAKRLVDQWLKIVTESTETEHKSEITLIGATTTMTPQATASLHAPSVGAAVAPNTTQGGEKSKNVHQTAQVANANTPAEASKQTTTKKGNEAGLVYKIVVKNGQQALSKVTKQMQSSLNDGSVFDDENGDSSTLQSIENGDTFDDKNTGSGIDEDEDSRISQEKSRKDSESSSDYVEKLKDGSKTVTETGEKSLERKEQKSSKDDKDRERKNDKIKDRRPSSSHRSSSSGHKSSSSKSSSSSSRLHSSSSRSSSDKHRSGKERSSSSSSSKDKDRKEGGSNSSSSSSKHRSSSSKTSSSSTSSKDRHREKDKATSSSSSSLKKDKEKEAQAEKDKDTLLKITSPSLDKLGKIPKKAKEDSDPAETVKPTSITIPSKKASISIEIGRTTEKTKTVKTYKSQFRSHGLNEEAPPPPSRKGLKKPGSTPAAPGTIIPSTLPSSLKRSSQTARDTPAEKQAKLDINNINVSNEKPGAIKLIAPKKIPTLVETNLFADALIAATGPKKSVKRKRSSTPGGKDEPGTPTSPDAPKVAALKFYQDTLDEGKSEEKSDKENEDSTNAKDTNGDESSSGDNAIDDDDIPLKIVKEDIAKKVAKEKKSDGSADLTNEDEDTNGADGKESREEEDDTPPAERKPGPGCGPDGPPGVLMLHRRKGPKKKLTWRPQEQLEQVRFFELDETERVNVTKSSFNDMKNLERFGERDAIKIARRGFNSEDNMQPTTPWRPLHEFDGLPSQPHGSLSKERNVQAQRESTTLRALYFSQAMIPDSPAEAELQPNYQYDVPIIPLEDITGNPDGLNDYSRMAWPEPKGSSNHLGDSGMMAGGGGLNGFDAPVDMFGGGVGSMGNSGVGGGPPYQFLNQFNAPPQPMPMPVGRLPPGIWQSPANGAAVMNPFNGSPSDNIGVNGPMGMGGVGGPPQNFMGPFGPGIPFVPFGPGNAFNGPNFCPPPPMMNGSPGGPRNNNNNNNRNNNNGGGGGNWRSGGNNFQDNKNSGGGGGGWRPAGSGPNRASGSGGGGNNSGICKAFNRGHCRLGKACKFVHPKNKRL